MKVRYIDLGLVDPVYDSALWEFSRIIKPKYPTIFTMQGNAPFVTFPTSTSGIEDLYKDNFPPNFKFLRSYHPSPYSVRGAFYADENVLMTFIHLPGELVDLDHIVEKEYKGAMLTLIKLLRERGLPVFYYTYNDGCFIYPDGKTKKFAGGMAHYWKDNNYVVISLAISFKLDYPLMNKTVNFSIDKIAKKGNITDMRDIVVGIDEFDSNLSIETVKQEWVSNYIQRKELELIDEGLTVEEQLKLNELVADLDSDDWVFKRIHPREDTI